MTVQYKLVDFLDSDYDNSNPIANFSPDTIAGLGHAYGVAGFYMASGSMLAIYEWKEGNRPNLTHYQELLSGI